MRVVAASVLLSGVPALVAMSAWTSGDGPAVREALAQTLEHNPQQTPGGPLLGPPMSLIGRARGTWNSDEGSLFSGGSSGTSDISITVSRHHQKKREICGYEKRKLSTGCSTTLRCVVEGGLSSYTIIMIPRIFVQNFKMQLNTLARELRTGDPKTTSLAQRFCNHT